MRRSVLFEAVLVMLLIALMSLLIVAVMSGRDEDMWNVKGVIAAPDNYYYGWPGPGNSNMFPADDGTLFTFDGNAVHALSGHGDLMWSCDVPTVITVNDSGRTYNLSLTGYGDRLKALSASTRDGNLYLLVGSETHAGSHGMLLAISPDGQIMWQIPFLKPDRSISPANYTHMYPLHVQVNDDVIMVFSLPSGLTMIGMNGSILRTMNNIISVPSVDEEGIFYARAGTQQVFNGYGLYVNSSVNAYYPDGTLKWQKGDDTVRINDSVDLTPWLLLEPLYKNGTLYVWLSDGIMALDRSGELKWEQHIEGSTVVGYGFDRNDTLYLSYITHYGSLSGLNASGSLLHPDLRGVMTIARDGSVLDNQRSSAFPFVIGGPAYLPEGIYYLIEWELPGITPPTSYDTSWYVARDYPSVIEFLRSQGAAHGPIAGNLSDLWRPVISAYSVRTGERLWQKAIPQVRLETCLTPDNAGMITVDSRMIGYYNGVPPEVWYQANGVPQGSKGLVRMPLGDVLVSNDTIYANVWSYCYEVPAFYNHSRCVFAGGIYAFDRDGRIVWSRATGSRVVGLHEQNGTVYFGSGDGRVSATRIGFLGGIVAASAYLCLRFVLFGSVARARERLDRNGNRNRVLQYIQLNPGASMFEMSQALGMNIGTVRYHLLVLGMSHRITAFRADEKYVRYFTSAGTFSKNDRLIISLMRREPLKKILNALCEKPGLSNQEISRALDTHESSTMRSINELTRKGIVVRSLQPDGRISYSINSEYHAHTVSAITLLGK